MILKRRKKKLKKLTGKKKLKINIQIHQSYKIAFVWLMNLKGREEIKSFIWSNYSLNYLKGQLRTATLLEEKKSKKKGKKGKEKIPYCFKEKTGEETKIYNMKLNF